jgi:hypothetical protein
MFDALLKTCVGVGLYTVVVVARVLGCSSSPPLGFTVDSGLLSRMLRLLLVAGCVFSMREAVLPLVVAFPPAVVNLPPLTLVLLAFDNLLPEETRVPSSMVFLGSFPAASGALWLYWFGHSCCTCSQRGVVCCCC